MQLMVVKPGPVKRIFAPYKGERLSTLSWDPPPTPPGVRKRKAAEMAAAAYVHQASAQQQPLQQPQQQPEQQTDVHHDSLPGPPVRANNTARKPQLVPVLPSQQPQVAAQKPAEDEVPQQEAVPSESSSDEGVVDFMSEDENEGQPEITGDQTSELWQDHRLSRFDDGEDDQPLLQKGPRMPAAAAVFHAAASAAATATDLSRFKDSKDDESTAFWQASQQAAATAAASDAAAASAAARDPDLSRFDDNDTDNQPQRQGLATDDNGKLQTPPDAQQQAAIMFAAAVAPPDLSSFDDSDDDVIHETASAVSRQPVTTATKLSSAAVPKVAKPDAANQAASQQASLPASESTPGAESALGSQHSSSSDSQDGTALGSGGHNVLSSDPTEQHDAVVQSTTLALKHQGHSDRESSSTVGSQADSDMESELGSEMSHDSNQVQSSDNSGEMLKRRDDEQSVSNSGEECSAEASHLHPEAGRLNWQDAVHTTVLPSPQQPHAQLADEEDSNASEASGDCMQDGALQTTASAPSEGVDLEVDGSAPLASTATAVQEANINEAPLYPGNLHCFCILNWVNSSSVHCAQYTPMVLHVPVAADISRDLYVYLSCHS